MLSTLYFLATLAPWYVLQGIACEWFELKELLGFGC
jgi:hypothetical protein